METKRQRITPRLYRHRYKYMMLAPAVILIFVFSYLTLLGWVIAFKNYQIGLSILHADWIGFKQFKEFLTKSEDYIYLLKNTLIMNILMIVVNLFMAVTFAILINELRNKYFARIVQTISFFPFFISWVIVYAIVYALLAVSSGAINESLVQYGVIKQGFNILGDPIYSWELIIIMNLWKLLGYNGVIFIAAISSITPEEYEAAAIDGANRWQRMIHITLPNLIPTFLVLLIMNSGWILNSNFEMYYLFTNSTNWSKMEVLDMYIYRYGLKLSNYPYATAVGIMKSFVSIFIIHLVNMLSKRVSGKSIL